MRYKRSLLKICFLLYSVFTFGKASPVFNSSMVLQRNAPIVIWGTSNQGQQIIVKFGGLIKETTTKEHGFWEVTFPAMTAGGPYILEIQGEVNEKFNDILIGDLFLASGQSNMEMPMKGFLPECCPVENAQIEIAKAKFPQIRFTTVPKLYSIKESNNIKKLQWNKATSGNISNFSAVAYFFAKKVHLSENIPIGIITSAYGGSKIQSWISSDGHSGNKYSERLLEIEKDELTIDLLSSQRELQFKKWLAKIDAEDQGLTSELKWYSNNLDTSRWDSIPLPTKWDSPSKQKLKNFQGAVWFRKKVLINPDALEKDLVIDLGRISQNDEVWINGHKVGGMRDFWSPRKYEIPKSILKAGYNIVTLRISETNNFGSILGDVGCVCIRDLMYSVYIPLSGFWDFKIGVRSKEPAVLYKFDQNSEPSILFNAMIFPLLKLNISGVLWYQGEGNVGNAEEYSMLLKRFIYDWRQKFNQPNLPFFIVQLPNYGERFKEPQLTSNWAEFREAQYKAALKTQSSIAVTIDLGDFYEIHPPDKKTVGERLALLALNKLYKRNIQCEGPVLKSVDLKESYIELSFKNIDNGYWISDNYGYIKGFSVMDKNGKLYFAKADISGKTIRVYTKNIKNPIEIRYSWEDNPKSTLYNKEGLPVMPFKKLIFYEN